jgi:DUF4097 and DUF4098 domain-containing protein YvlB
MKQHLFNVGNLFAVSILLFAFYLNFINKNTSPVSMPNVNVEAQQPKENSTTIVENPEEYLNTRISMLNSNKKFTPVYADENSPSL